MENEYWPYLKRLIAIIGAAATLLILIACEGNGDDNGNDQNPTALPQGLYEKYPIDGVVAWSELIAVMNTTVEIRDNWGGGVLVSTSDVRWAWANDDRYIYLAIEWTDDTYNHGYTAAGPVDFDGVQVKFDNDGNGINEAGDDKRTVIAIGVGSQYIDGNYNPIGDENDQVVDGFGKLRYDAGDQKYSAEFLLPLIPDANGEDADFSSAPTYSIAIFENANIGIGQVNFGSTHGLGPDSTAWIAVPYTVATAHDYPDMPANLSGLIVFTSEHETTNNEIYSFDPATGTTAKITDLPGLFKDNPSLSHDRTRVAFHGAPNPTDYANYEIYIIDIDGTGLTQLTNNNILDGHPGWHPDNSTIAYASFRDGGQASIVLIDDTGAELADLTPSGMGYDENDPDFLPDGRIVFKTNRFSTFPQVRIAVMDPDGSNIVQLTDLSGVSDHDPVGDATHVIFERFNKGTDYATDLEALFTPWDIVEVRLDGTNETVLLSDVWVNWLPVYSPNGEYILYLKSAGYTAAHLMTLDGEELGRLIPGMTRIKYVDWK